MIKAVIFDMFETLITHYRTPLYFSKEMAKDMNLAIEVFQPLWRESEQERTLGNKTLKEVLEEIGKQHHIDLENVERVIQKRIKSKEECFKTMHEEIIPLFKKLKQQGIKIGLISNCFDEEAMVIRKSILFPYFDKICLSCEEHVAKPDKEIFHRCVEALDVAYHECMYIGDGGSFELETAQSLGMKTYQATWYFNEKNQHIWQRKRVFQELASPLQLLEELER